MISSKEQNSLDKFINECASNYSYIWEVIQKFHEHQDLILGKISNDLLQVLKERGLIELFSNKLGISYNIKNDFNTSKKEVEYLIGVGIYNSKYDDNISACFIIFFKFNKSVGWSLNFGYNIETNSKTEAKIIAKKIKDFGFQKEPEDSFKDGTSLYLDLLEINLNDFNNPTPSEFNYQLDKNHEALITSISEDLFRLDYFVFETCHKDKLKYPYR